MTDDLRPLRLSVRFSQAEADAISGFQEAEKLASQAEAIRLLVEIGLDVVSQHGRRFWDKGPDDPSEPPTPA